MPAPAGQAASRSLQSYGSRFHATDPTRLFDTRSGLGNVPAKPIAAASILEVNVAGAAGVPPSGTTAVVLNVTAASPTEGGYLTVYPSDVATPTASNLNFAAGQTIPNLVVVRVPANGKIRFFNATGTTHVIADVVGYFDTKRQGEAGRFIAVPPKRVADTRQINDPLTPNKIGIVAPFESSPDVVNAAAAVLNVTVTRPTAAGYLTVFPADACLLPNASNLNFQAGETAPNLVIVRLSGVSPCAERAGRIRLFNSTGTADVIVDVFGYFTADS